MHTNALIREKSPYLIQHAHNPVNWLPWGEAAFELARKQDRPIFLSIGYSTCHWCHVMERESFESEAIAELLNRDFISIKVDREERPDVDRVYMYFVQAFSGSGGWPMSVWLTPELKPFFGGTYFPPDSRYGRPGFASILEQVAGAWNQNRQKIESSSIDILQQLRRAAGEGGSDGESLGQGTLELAFQQFRRSFDSRWGGFGGAPKFPRPVTLGFLLRYHAITGNPEALEMVTETLLAMARGGMHDHLGGGFHRYSVDQRWFVPHFEKMLYDQGQLAVSYLEAFQLTRQPQMADIARRLFEYVLRDMTDAEGGFYSAEDADSIEPGKEGHKVEGAFYVWSAQEIEQRLDRRSAALFSHRYGMQPEGNVMEDPHGEFGGKNILSEAFTIESTAQEYGFPEAEVRESLGKASEILFEVRCHRPRPHLDDKVLVAWNSLMISAFAKGYAVLGEAQYLKAAKRAESFIASRLFSPQTGILLRRFRDGDADIPAFLDDYGLYLHALLDLFEVDPVPEYLERALDIAKRGLSQFEDSEHGGFFSTAAEDPTIVLRIKDEYDGAEPSGNAVAADALLRLAKMTGVDEYSRRAAKVFVCLAKKVGQQPTTAPYLLAAVGRHLSPPEQTVLRFEASTPAIEQAVLRYRQEFKPFGIVLALSDRATERLAAALPLLAGLPRQGELTLYRCRNYACDLPEVLA
jgi:uncharacterized protein YyaL (SSP411 family)